MRTDVVVIGAGLAGLVVAAELADAGRRVVLLDAEARPGGQAAWSSGALFLADTPEQRRLRIRDDVGLALSDWVASAGFDDGPADAWSRRWARSYVAASGTDMSPWLRAMGIGFLPVVEWVERGGDLADGPGNSVPRLHRPRGGGSALVDPFLRRVEARRSDGLVDLRLGHHVDRLTVDGSGRVTGCTARDVAGDQVEVQSAVVVVATGGIGGTLDVVRRWWPSDLGAPPDDMLQGVPDHVNGHGLRMAQDAGGRVVHLTRMHIRADGLTHHRPAWSHHGIRVHAAPDMLWLDARGRRLPPPLFPGIDTLQTVRHLAAVASPHSWLLTNRRAAATRLRLSGAERSGHVDAATHPVTRARVRPSRTVTAFLDGNADVVVADDPAVLVAGMNRLTGQNLIDESSLRRQVLAYDRQVASGLANDAQLTTADAARRYLPTRLRTPARPRRVLERSGRPLISILLRPLARTSLGGLQTDLSCRVLGADGAPVLGLYAAGEVAGFGGGGVHGVRSLGGTFLGACLHSALRAARGIQTDRA